MIWLRTDAQLRLVGASADWPAWARQYAPAAVVDGGIGHSLWDVIPDVPTREIVRSLLARVHEGHHAQLQYRYWSHDHCHDIAIHIDRCMPEGEGFIVSIVHLREALDAERPAPDPDDEPLIAMCAWCGRARGAGGEWVEFDEFVRQAGLFTEGHVPGITHGICDACSAAFPASRPRSERRPPSAAGTA